MSELVPLMIFVAVISTITTVHNTVLKGLSKKSAAIKPDWLYSFAIVTFCLLLSGLITGLTLGPFANISMIIIFSLILCLLTLAIQGANEKNNSVLKSYIMCAVPLFCVFHFFLYCNIHWKYDLLDQSYDTLRKYTYCIGFPFPAEGRFDQMSSGDFLIIKSNLVLDLLVYFFLSLVTYYVFFRKVDYSKIISRVGLMIYYSLSCLYLLVVLHCTGGTYYWPDNIHLHGFYFQWFFI
jgi:hypothetical protein